ncbi:hypothetical protein B0H17DRAFT_1210258 [Mycena rosella]|uniref:Uncharacterized protein n=1 Tax=Mycena rosella TaxID=1033263 RepID=A0AAD7CWJ2_MYCRO|nr:hypothetical protein B0H17DRAFT_1210258 [Mycena rosella]
MRHISLHSAPLPRPQYGPPLATSSPSSLPSPSVAPPPSFSHPASPFTSPRTAIAAGTQLRVCRAWGCTSAASVWMRRRGVPVLLLTETKGDGVGASVSSPVPPLRCATHSLFPPPVFPSSAPLHPPSFPVPFVAVLPPLSLVLMLRGVERRPRRRRQTCTRITLPSRPLARIVPLFSLVLHPLSLLAFPVLLFLVALPFSVLVLPIFLLGVSTLYPRLRSNTRCASSSTCSPSRRRCRATRTASSSPSSTTSYFTTTSSSSTASPSLAPTRPALAPDIYPDARSLTRHVHPPLTTRRFAAASPWALTASPWTALQVGRLRQLRV